MDRAAICALMSLRTSEKSGLSSAAVFGCDETGSDVTSESIRTPIARVEDKELTKQLAMADTPFCIEDWQWRDCESATLIFNY